MNIRFIRASIFLSLFLSLIFLVSACSTFPVQEMSDARQALEAAQAVNASERAPVEYHEAQVLLKDADRFVNEGRFELAKKVARRAKIVAMDARRKAMTTKD